MTAPPTLSQYLTRWLDEVVKPNREPATHAYYEAMTRLHIIPGLGSTPLGQLQTRDVQAWLDTLPGLCQCCVQGKDAGRPEPRRRGCAIGACCHHGTGRRTIQAARNTLRAALSHAIASGELTCRNPAGLATLPSQARARRRKNPSWSLEQANRFLASARDDEDPLYAAYVLILVNALRTGEVLGLTWPSLHLDRAELKVSWQLQRVGTELIHKERTKTGHSGTGRTLPLPAISVAALKLRPAGQDTARELAGDRWQPSDLVFTTRWGTPIEPRNFTRSFGTRCAKAGVPQIRPGDTRHTCAPILAHLGVHPAEAMRILAHARISRAARHQLSPSEPEA